MIVMMMDVVVASPAVVCDDHHSCSATLCGDDGSYYCSFTNGVQATKRDGEKEKKALLMTLLVYTSHIVSWQL